MTNKEFIFNIFKVSGFEVTNYEQTGDLYEIEAYNQIIDEHISIASRIFEFVLADILHEIYETNFEKQIPFSASPNLNPFCGIGFIKV